MADISWQVVTVKLSQLTPWEQNPKTSTAKNAKQLVSSVDELGQFQTVAIGPFDASGMATVYDGHQRLSAWLRQFGADYEAQALQASRPLSEQERRKIAIYSRQIGAWDWDILSGWEPEELTGWGFDVDLLGDWRRDVAALGNFLESEAAPLGDGDAEPQTNRAEELRQEWGVEPGQLWRLPSRTPVQEHRLICGDCTDAMVVKRVMGGEVADCAFTSFPYAVGVDYGETYEDDIENLRRLLDVVPSVLYSVIHNGGFFVVNFGDIASGRNIAETEDPSEIPMALEYYPRFKVQNWFLWSRRIWCKPNPRVHSPWCIQSNRAATDWEHLWTFKKNGSAIIKRVDGELKSALGWYQSSLMHGVDEGKSVHGAGMAVGIAEWMINVHSAIKSVIVEPFTGTGTTIIAAENLARQCRAVEISPAYVAVALQRYLDAFGIRAELISED